MRVLWLALLLAFSAQPDLAAQGGGRWFVGGLFGVSTLSADGRAVVTPAMAGVSLYKPENGPAVDTVFGAHLHRFISVQANYMWNRNRMTLHASSVTAAGDDFYEQERSSSQQVLVGDLLVYVRALESAVRPYFSVGGGFVWFDSHEVAATSGGSLEPPAARFEWTGAAFRVAVGIDFVVHDGWNIRYSFGETISRNPVSSELTPRGLRNLANFESLFGVVREW